MTHTPTQAAPDAGLLFRLSGIAAILAGLIFAGIQPIHPPDVTASVTGLAWSLILPLKLVMSYMFLAGIAGIYARQVSVAGWLGLIGFVLFSAGWAIQSGFIFMEVFVLPVLATPAPQVVDSILGIVNGTPGETDVTAMIVTYGIAGVFYLLGGVLLGLATFRARVFPRWAGMLLAVTALVTPAAALLPHALQRYAAVPMGIAMIWLGMALVFNWTQSQAGGRNFKPGSALA